MLNIRKYAAIDIGSNAVRLLVANIIEQPDKPTQFKKSSLVRVPIRLGADVFKNKEISENSINRLSDTILAFKLLMKSHGVERFKACATSAMREALNGQKISDQIAAECGIRIDIIGGEEEAKIIASTDINAYIDKNKTYLYVDVGGGSTELSIFYQGEKIKSQSFKIGTVRMLNGRVKGKTWKLVKKWIEKNTRDFDRIDLIGTGGNINKIFKISGKSMGEPLSYFYLTAFLHKLKSHSYEERITEMDLNQDRADVIIPATEIYLKAMNWSRSKHIYVPKIGLSDGIIKSIYYELINGQEMADIE